MGVPRRTVLVGAAVTLAGCSGVTTGGDPGTDSPPGGADDTGATNGTGATTDTGSTATTPQPTAESPGCDPTDVTRPAVPTGAAVEGRSYPAVPAQLTPESATTFLAEFETAFAWNRALAEYPDATGVRVRTLDAFEPTTGDDGVRATGRLRVFVMIDEGDGDRRVERDDYVVGYAVDDDGGLYRAELADRATDPLDSASRQLVACGTVAEN